MNNKGPTLTIIKSENDEIFGGFTKSNWNNENFAYGYDEDAFLYSITNKKIFDVIKPVFWIMIEIMLLLVLEIQMIGMEFICLMNSWVVLKVIVIQKN